MSDRTHRGLAVIIAIGMVIAVASAPTLAQVGGGGGFEVAALNAHTVDGVHAVRYATKQSKRANKLVATNAAGYLPSNIVKPAWGYIKNKPAGSADGVDNVGVWKMEVTNVASGPTTIIAGGTGNATAYCPTGSRAIGGGFTQSGSDLRLTHSYLNGLRGWGVDAKSVSSVSRSLWAEAICLVATPAGALS
jgi:hypothetical protein